MLTNCARGKKIADKNVFYTNKGLWLKEVLKNPFQACPHPLQGTVQNVSHYVSPGSMPDKKNTGGVLVSLAKAIADKFQFEFVFKKTRIGRYNTTTKQYNKGTLNDVSSKSLPLKAHLHMAKNFRRSLDEVSMSSRRSFSEGFFFAGKVFLHRDFVGGEFLI